MACPSRGARAARRAARRRRRARDRPPDRPRRARRAGRGRRGRCARPRSGPPGAPRSPGPGSSPRSRPDAVLSSVAGTARPGPAAACAGARARGRRDEGGGRAGGAGGRLGGGRAALGRLRRRCRARALAHDLVDRGHADRDGPRRGDDRAGLQCAAAEEGARADAAHDLADARRGVGGLDPADPGEPDGDGPRGDGGRGDAQGGARTAHELADGGVVEPELGPDVGVRPAVDGDGEQRRALALGERGDGVEGLAHVLALLDLGGGARTQVRRLDQRGVVASGLLHGVQGSVVHDAVEPGPQVTDRRPVAQRPPGAHERRLHHILGARLLREEPSRVAQQRPAVAVDDRVEGTVVPGDDQVDQPLVRLRAQQCDGDVWGHRCSVC